MMQYCRMSIVDMLSDADVCAGVCVCELALGKMDSIYMETHWAYMCTLADAPLCCRSPHTVRPIEAHSKN